MIKSTAGTLTWFCLVADNINLTLDAAWQVMLFVIDSSRTHTAPQIISIIVSVSSLFWKMEGREILGDRGRAMRDRTQNSPKKSDALQRHEIRKNWGVQSYEKWYFHLTMKEGGVGNGKEKRTDCCVRIYFLPWCGILNSDVTLASKTNSAAEKYSVLTARPLCAHA